MGVEDGTFQILRTRLADRAAELGRRAAELNTRRQEVFGAPVLELAASARLRTAAEATACGIIAIRPGVLLLGTSAPGLAEGMLSLHDEDGGPLDPGTVPGLLDDERFHRDLADRRRRGPARGTHSSLGRQAGQHHPLHPAPRRDDEREQPRR